MNNSVFSLIPPCVAWHPLNVLPSIPNSFFIILQSATEGADSKPGTQPGSPTEEQAGQIGAVTTKVTQGVKSFGSFLYSSATKAGEKIKKTVDSHVSSAKRTGIYKRK